MLMLIRSVTIATTISLLLLSPAAQAASGSQDYRLMSSLVSSSGRPQASSSFRSQSSLSEPVIDASGNENHQLGIGFIYTIAEFDTTPPDPPTADPLNSPTNQAAQVIAGTKSEDTERIAITSPRATTEDISYPTSATWSCAATLAEGNNDFTVKAEDKSGNQSTSMEFTIVLDTVPPEVAITLPHVGALLNTEEVTVAYTVDGIPETEDFTLTEGPNTVTIEETDLAGNTGSDSITVTLDTVAPVVTVISPSDGATVNSSTITVAYTVDGAPTTQDFTLTEGENTLTVAAVDEAGNETSASVAVTYYAGQTIGPEGGTVFSQNGDVVLEIPEGALESPHTIIAIDREGEDFSNRDIPGDTVIVGALEIKPSGLSFTKPVTLHIPLYEPQIPGTPLQIYLLPEAQDSQPQAALNGFFGRMLTLGAEGESEDEIKTSFVDATGYSTTTEVNHFSIYVALKSMISSGAPIGGGVDIPTPDLFTGAFTHDIPIEIPKGRKDMHPNISLQYRSGNPNTWVGFGWQLNPGYIQRSTKKGIPTYNDQEDTFVFMSQSQSTELVRLADNLYQAKVEGAFIKYYKEDNDTWYLLSKDGNRMYFGEAPNSKQAGSGGTFGWYLTRAVDTNGNYVEFNYTKDQGRIYPENILYTGNENTATPPKYEVSFSLEGRGDISSSYISGEECRTEKRLKIVEVFCDSELVWTYELNYIYSADTARSLLKSVVQKGGDGTSYPAKVFNYQER